MNLTYEHFAAKPAEEIVSELTCQKLWDCNIGSAI